MLTEIQDIRMESTMIETVVALLLIMNNEIVEHRIQPEGMAQCLRRKRHAERDYHPGVQHSCIKSKAEVEQNIDGSWYIKKLILD